MPLILNVETATDICSICLSKGENIIAFQETEQAYEHASKITLLIDACLKSAKLQLSDLDAVAISKGPGSYTALRIGTATAKGICYALKKPLIIVDTLQALALASLKQEQKKAIYAPMIDARRMEVYIALFDENNTPITAPKSEIITTNSFSKYLQEGHLLVLSGNGAEKCKSVLNSPKIQYNPVKNSSRHLVPLAQKAFINKTFADLAYYEPLYLKPPNITTPKKIL